MLKKVNIKNREKKGKILAQKRRKILWISFPLKVVAEEDEDGYKALERMVSDDF